jgi:hypothetical protein
LEIIRAFHPTRDGIGSPPPDSLAPYRAVDAGSTPSWHRPERVRRRSRARPPRGTPQA